MNLPVNPQPASEPPPTGFVPVAALEPGGAEAAAFFLANPLEKVTARMRKNMKQLRTRVFPSRAPIVCTKARPHLGGVPGPMTYAYAMKAIIAEDVKLEKRLARKTARQLEKIVLRGIRRALRAEETAALQVQPGRQQLFLAHAAELRHVAAYAKFELGDRRGESAFKNPDGN